MGHLDQVSSDVAGLDALPPRMRRAGVRDRRRPPSCGPFERRSAVHHRRGGAQPLGHPGRVLGEGGLGPKLGTRTSAWSPPATGWSGNGRWSFLSGGCLPRPRGCWASEAVRAGTRRGSLSTATPSNCWNPVPKHVRQARTLGVEAFEGHARALPYNNESADAVLMLGLLYHLSSASDRALALEQAVPARARPLW